MSLSMRAETVAPQTIAGGFVLVPVRQLLVAWRACRQRPLGVGDYRTWLACREMVARRCSLDDGRSPTYGFAELARLTDVSEKRARYSINRLAAAGLLIWSNDLIGFPDSGAPDDSLTDSIGGGEGSLAIPRRMLRLLVAGARPALIATVLALLLRCLARGRGGFRPRGRVKATWIARVFGVDVRRVKQARKELVALGWIVPQQTDQWAENKWGRVYHIDLAWERAPAQSDGSRLPPPPAGGGHQLPPPDLHPDPLREDKNQEPAPRGPAGVEIKGAGEQIVSPSPVASETPPSRGDGTPGPVSRRPASITDGAGEAPAPTLNEVRDEDLKDTGRLLRLFDQAVARGVIEPSESDRFRFVAAAEHALAVGKGNPPGLFMSLVRGRLWRYLTQGDEDATGARLRRHLFGCPGDSGPCSSGPTAAVRPGLSRDATLVRVVRAELARAGYRGDPFPLVRARDGSWTRERWDAASAESEGVRDGP